MTFSRAFVICVIAVGAFGGNLLLREAEVLREIRRVDSEITSRHKNFHERGAEWSNLLREKNDLLEKYNTRLMNKEVSNRIGQIEKELAKFDAENLQIEQDDAKSGKELEELQAKLRNPFRW